MKIFDQCFMVISSDGIAPQMAYLGLDSDGWLIYGSSDQAQLWECDATTEDDMTTPHQFSYTFKAVGDPYHDYWLATSKAILASSKTRI